MRVQRGDVVLLPIAFTTGVGGKVRPALVVQSDHNNARLNATIVAIITKTTHRATTEATQLLIDVNSSPKRGTEPEKGDSPKRGT